jgi:ferritin-like metal-binding protein YciE
LLREGQTVPLVEGCAVAVGERARGHEFRKLHGVLRSDAAFEQAFGRAPRNRRQGRRHAAGEQGQARSPSEPATPPARAGSNLARIRAVIARERTMETLDDLFLHILKDVYFAEKAIAKALPKLARNAQSQALAKAFTDHREQTMGQIARLEQAFELVGQRAKAETCEAIKGLIDEGDEIIKEFEEGAVRDAGLLACAQAVEHYEMGRYGALIAWAKTLGKSDVAELLRQNLDEEKQADQMLSRLATSEINKAALAMAETAEAPPPRRRRSA